MKYLTKEWWQKMELCSIAQDFRVNKKAEQKNEEFYNWAYEKAYNELFQCKDALTVFGGEEHKRSFNKTYTEIYERNQNLPKEILEEVADIRVFTLGYTTSKIKDMIKEYCASLIEDTLAWQKKARKQTDEAKKHLAQTIDFCKYEKCMLNKIEKQGDELLLDFYDDILCIKDGEIVEWEDEELYRNKKDKSIMIGSMVGALELHYEKGVYELHFLTSGWDWTHSEDKHNWGYLTVKGTDITEKKGKKMELDLLEMMKQISCTKGADNEDD